jgi:phosphoribosyl 1,2-cyclic phosphate phosphodiesterase
MAVSPTPVSADIAGQLIILGTGTSVGVPVIGCGCVTCRSAVQPGGNPRNRRTRCSLVLGLPEGNLLIDTPPDLHSQLLREGIGIIHAVAYTHEHVDHVYGLDDVRIFPFYLQRRLPIYCEEEVEQRIRRAFDYAFASSADDFRPASVPHLELRRLTTQPLEVLGARVTPFRLLHGPFSVLGFRIGGVAYCTDTNHIPEESWQHLQGLDVLILDCLRQRPHATHFGLDQAVDVARRVGAKRTLFTHISHELEYDATNAALPQGMELAYDGQRIDLNLDRVALP